MSSKGRTKLQLSQFGAKFDEEVAGNIRFCIAPPKIGENVKKTIFFQTISATIFFLASTSETSGIV